MQLKKSGAYTIKKRWLRGLLSAPAESQGHHFAHKVTHTKTNDEWTIKKTLMVLYLTKVSYSCFKII